MSGTKSDYTPSGLRNLIEDTLKSSNTYGGKLVKWEECFTIEYADINGIEFSIDVVPAVDDSNDNKKRLITKGINFDIVDTSIAIPRQNSEKSYRWISNNPKGFKKWFDEINAPFLKYTDEYMGESMYDNVSIEELPNDFKHSALQRVIQILKYQRDAYFAHRTDGDNIKPISALITTIAAQIASKYSNKRCSVFELLEYVIAKLEICIHQTEMSFDKYRFTYDDFPVILFQNGNWLVPNPADPEDNLADKWNTDKRIPEAFFKWISVTRKNLFELLANDDDKQFGVFLTNSFGVYSPDDTIIKKYRNSNVAVPIDATTASKPYCRL